MFNNAYTFTYPETSSELGTVTLETIPSTAGRGGSFRAENRFGHADWPLFNPCTIHSVRCNVTYSTVTPLDPCSDVTGIWMRSYGAIICRTSAVNVYYIGRNGGHGSTNNLVAQNKAMADFGSDQYIVLGFHEPVSQLGGLVDNTYTTKMASTFSGHFLDLNKEIRDRAAEITWRTGVYASMDEYNTSDKAATDRSYVSGGNIPKSLYKSDGYHPNEYGCKAFAMLIHDKMVKLGYLDDDYILSTGGDL